MNSVAAPLRVIIVDDEPMARKLLVKLLDVIGGVEILAQSRNGREAIAATQDLSPDLLILDVQMPGMNGFDVVKALQSDVMPNVIFCTAYQRYALAAFDLHAVDYVTKPVGEQRLARAMDRARQRLASGSGEQQKLPLIGAINEITRAVSASNLPASGSAFDQKVSGRRIAIKMHDNTLLIDSNDIDWVDAAGDYMCVHVDGETHILRSTLKNLLARLDESRFVRIHRSTIVNLERIVKATPLTKGEFMLDLDGGHRLKVSRNYRRAIKEFLSVH